MIKARCGYLKTQQVTLVLVLRVKRVIIIHSDPVTKLVQIESISQSNKMLYLKQQIHIGDRFSLL